jgi:DNA primase
VFSEDTEEIKALCPWPHRGKDGTKVYESKPSLSINKVKGVFHCFGCGRSGTIHRFLECFVGAFFADVLLVDHEFEREWSESDEAPAPLPFYNDGIDYLRKRGFTDETIKRFNLGESRQKDSAIIPIHDNEGTYAGWKARNRSTGHYFSGYGLKAEGILFNYHTWANSKSEPLFVVEGEFDCLWLEQHGRRTVGLLGATDPKRKTPEKWKALAVRTGEVILCLDNDGVGQRCTELLKEYLEKEGVKVRVAKFPDKYKDVQDIPSHLVRRYIK